MVRAILPAAAAASGFRGAPSLYLTVCPLHDRNEPFPRLENVIVENPT